MDKQQTLQFPINVSMCAWFRHQSRLFVAILAIFTFIAYFILSSHPVTPLRIYNFDLGFVLGPTAFMLFVFFLISISSHPADIRIEKSKITVKTIPLMGLSSKTKTYHTSDFDNIKTYYGNTGRSTIALVYLRGKNVDDIIFEPPVPSKSGFFEGLFYDSIKEDLQNYAHQLAELLKIKVVNDV